MTGREARGKLRRIIPGRRDLSFMVLVALAAFTLYFLNASPPFMAIASNSMEPTLSRGDIIFVKDVLPSQIEEGDIITFEVPRSVQTTHNYPALLTHRVVRITESRGELSFRTKGDNTNEDPFTVTPHLIRGEYSSGVPFLGYLVFFLQSRQGLIFVVVGALIYLAYSHSEELTRRGRSMRHALVAPFTEDLVHSNQELQQRQEQTSQIVGNALEQFARAMGEYATHLESHTTAVKGLASGSQDLQAAVRDQNQVLGQLKETLAGAPARPRFEPQRPAPQPKIGTPPGCYRGKERPIHS